MAKGALNISRDIVLVPDLMELSDEEEERNEQDDRGAEDEARGPSHRCRMEVVVYFFQVKLCSALLIAVFHCLRLEVQILTWTNRMRVLETRP